MPSKRLYSLDFLKVVAMILIVCHHFQQVNGGWHEGLNFFGGAFYFGYLVEFFFILSGMFMVPYISRIHQGLRFKSFFLRRALRLLPLVAITAVVYEILVIILAIRDPEAMIQGLSLWGVVLDSLGIQDGWAFLSPGVNNPTWYICVLLLCYVLFFAGTKICAHFKVSANYFYVIMILLGCALIEFEITGPFLTPGDARGYRTFFFGILLAQLLQKDFMQKKWVGIAALVTLLTSLITFPHPNLAGDFVCLLIYIYYPALIILFCTPLVSKALNWKGFATLGGIAFNAYVWHSPLLVLLQILKTIPSFSLDCTTYLATLGFVVVVFGVSALSYFFIEKPINKRAEEACLQ